MLCFSPDRMCRLPIWEPLSPNTLVGQEELRGLADVVRCSGPPSPNQANPASQSLDERARMSDPGGGRGLRRARAGGLRLTGEMSRSGDLRRRPLRCPLDPVSPDPVVGLAGKAPVANRREQRDGFAIKAELPISGRERRHDASTASARAGMDRSRPLDCHVEDAGFKVGRNEIDESVMEPLKAGHPHLSLAITLPSMVYSMCCSSSRSR